MRIRNQRTGKFESSNPKDAVLKKRRDDMIRTALWPERRYTKTSTTASPQNGRGLR